MIEVREEFTSELSEVVEVGDGTERSLGHYVETKSGRYVVIPNHYRNFPPSEAADRNAAIRLLQQPTPVSR